jgi:hypothetical protein
LAGIAAFPYNRQIASGQADEQEGADMRPALKLNAIEQEHLQELYDAAGVSRDELPYSDQFNKLVQDFHDRTFKHAEHEQVFAALLKYVRSSTVSATDIGNHTLDPEQVKTLKAVLKRHGKSGKLVPHSSEFEAAHKEFGQLTKTQLAPRDFWLSIIRTQGRSRRPPTRKTATKAAGERDEESGDDDE